MINEQLLYLRPNVQVEPLVDHWYLWSHLIPPHTAARNLTERLLAIMDSYILAPQMHAQAVRDPKMIGGPFVDLDGQRVDEIKSLRDATKEKRAHLLELSNAILEADNLLRTNAKGYSLQPLYNIMPPILHGYVELVYDLNNNASLRIIEKLIYKSVYYDKSAQSLMLTLISGDDRPFVLSTPRLVGENMVHMKVPFDHDSVDKLFMLKRHPETWSKIKEEIPIPDGAENNFERLLTEQAPKPYDSYDGSGVRWRYFGHACILIEAHGLSFLFDPVLSYTYETDISRYTYDDLPERIDYAIVTHNHPDHILFETLLQLRHKISSIVVPKSGSGSIQDPSVKLLLEAIGFRNVIELGEMDEITFSGGGALMGLPFFGEHADLDIRAKLAYLLRIDSHSMIFAADSCNIEPKLYEHVHCLIGDVDVLFVGMECDGAPLSWLYGPLLTRKLDRRMDESRRLAGSNYQQAVDIVNRFRAREVYVYALGQEPWLSYIMSVKYSEQSNPIVQSNLLLENCRSRGIVAERLFGEKEILIDP